MGKRSAIATTEAEAAALTLSELNQRIASMQFGVDRDLSAWLRRSAPCLAGRAAETAARGCGSETQVLKSGTPAPARRSGREPVNGMRKAAVELEQHSSRDVRQG
jgi:hypothetical protein